MPVQPSFAPLSPAAHITPPTPSEMPPPDGPPAEPPFHDPEPSGPPIELPPGDLPTEIPPNAKLPSRHQTACGHPSDRICGLPLPGAAVSACLPGQRIALHLPIAQLDRASAF